MGDDLLRLAGALGFDLAGFLFGSQRSLDALRLVLVPGCTNLVAPVDAAGQERTSRNGNASQQDDRQARNHPSPLE